LLDVHPPHHAASGWRDFFTHLFTITIGLLIALSLEGLVDWQHNRHLVHEAEASLYGEIKSNAAGMDDTIADLHKQQAVLKQDVAVLKVITKTHEPPANSSLDITFHIRTFDNVSWRTAQSTGALALMPYGQAEEYSEIYGEQDMLAAAEQQAARDAIVGLGPLMNMSGSEKDPTEGKSAAVEEHVEVLQGQLLLVDGLMKGLDKKYKQFLSEPRD
jgi:hypothetical protein